MRLLSVTPYEDRLSIRVVGEAYPVIPVLGEPEVRVLPEQTR